MQKDSIANTFHMSYPFRPQHIHNLVEADFLEIQSLLRANHQKAYAIDYIRKVCNGEQNNMLIHRIALHYLSCINEALEKMRKRMEANDRSQTHI